MASLIFQHVSVQIPSAFCWTSSPLGLLYICILANALIRLMTLQKRHWFCHAIMAIE